MFPLSEVLLGLVALAFGVLWWRSQQAQRLDADRASVAESELKVAQSLLNQAQSEQQRLQTSLDQVNQDLNQANERNAALSAREAQLRENFETQRGALRDEFKALSSEMLEQRAKALEERSQESMSAVLAPLKEQIKTFRERTEQINRDATASHATLQSELKQLKELNQQITDEAANLTLALKGDSKQQGNWGEMQVELILDRAGLTRGLEYEREVSMESDEGQRFRPDVVVKLPEERCMIIDSKVSLTAWVDVVGAEDPAERAFALKRHLDSIKRHVDSLSKKDYAGLFGSRSPDFVLMFMPIEPAFQAAFEKQPDLYQYAYERNIIIVVPSTLLGMLRTVQNIWAQQRRNENSRELAEEATKLQDKLRIFAEKFDDLGKSIDRAHRSYQDATKSLTGRGALVRTIESFKEKGVQFKKALPSHLIENHEDDSD